MCVVASDTSFPTTIRRRPTLKVFGACITVAPSTTGRVRVFHFEWETVRATAASVTSFSRIMTRRQVISELRTLDGASALQLLRATSTSTAGSRRSDEHDIWLRR